MSNSNTLKEVMDSTDDTTRKLLGEILKIEKDHEYIQTMTTSIDQEISDRIVKLIQQEIKK
ncbi:MAG: hypothetical protein JW870_07330 [Candidatus Delongbacteria bacterium]|nr:hypothetical protein [Candidatus Delongbacteria bacterium]